MAKFRQEVLRKKESIVVRDKKSGNVQRVIFPNGIQVGLDVGEFNNGIVLQNLNDPPTKTNNALYAVAGSLYYNGSLVNSGLTIEEEGGSVAVNSVTEIKVSNGTLTDDGNGTVTIQTGGGGTGDANAQYVVLAATGSLSSERVLTAGDRVSISDGGAGGNVTITADQQAPLAAQYVVLSADGTLTGERVLTAGANITITDAGAGNSVTVRSDPDTESAILANQILGG